MKHFSVITSSILLAILQSPIYANDENLFSQSPINTENYLLLADSDDRRDRRDERGRSDERQDRRDCRQDEGRVGKDKRDCKQEEVRDGVRGNRGEDN